jgi:hypothetical protein
MSQFDLGEPGGAAFAGRGLSRKAQADRSAGAAGQRKGTVEAPEMTILLEVEGDNPAAHM